MNRVFGYIKGLHATHLLSVGARLGLFERVGREPAGVAPNALAAALGMDPTYVRLWCEAACAFELLDYEPASGYRLAPGLEGVLGDPDNPYYLGRFPDLHLLFARDYARYPELFRGGETYPFQAHDEAFLKSLAAATRVLPKMFLDAVLPRLPELRARLERGVEILDVGCGGGELVRTASAWAARRGGTARVTLIDFNRQICRRARRRFVQPSVLQADMFRTPFPLSSFDAIHCGLVLHHFNEVQGAELLRRLAPLCRRALIVSDLHRHPVPYLATAWGSRLLSRSRMVRHDGPLSIRRGFSRGDLAAVARRAGFEWTLLRRVWPYRWLAVLRTGPG